MNQTTKRGFGRSAALVAVMGLVPGIGGADEFTAQDVARWQAQFQSVAQTGQRLWADPSLGTNGVVCGQCHPNGTNTHPETYPKFQKQLGKVAQQWEMVNWCLRNPLQGQPLAADDARMTAILAYLAWERRGMPLEPGKH